jgi:hypothetical protein
VLLTRGTADLFLLQLVTRRLAHLLLSVVEHHLLHHPSSLAYRSSDQSDQDANESASFGLFSLPIPIHQAVSRDRRTHHPDRSAESSRA